MDERTLQALAAAFLGAAIGGLIGFILVVII